MQRFRRQKCLLQVRNILLSNPLYFSSLRSSSSIGEEVFLDLFPVKQKESKSIGEQWHGPGQLLSSGCWVGQKSGFTVETFHYVFGPDSISNFRSVYNWGLGLFVKRAVDLQMRTYQGLLCWSLNTSPSASKGREGQRMAVDWAGLPVAQ